MNVGFVKLYRSLHGSFHENYKTDYRCWQVYVHLLETCFWKDGEKYKADQVKMTVFEIKHATLLTRSIIRSSIKILVDGGHIGIERTSKWNNSGYIFTIIHSQQIANKKPTDSQQIANITQSNDNEKDGFEPTDSQQIANKKPTDSQSTEKKKEETKKKKEKESYINTGYRGVPQISPDPIAAAQPSPPSKSKSPPKSSEIWEAYKDTFMARYGQEPKRNAKVNALACQLHDRLGNSDAIEVVKFYLTHNNGWYLRNLHSLDQCVKDCEKLYVEWKKNDYVRTSDVQSAERMSDNEAVIRQAMQRYLDKKEATEREKQ